MLSVWQDPPYFDWENTLHTHDRIRHLVELDVQWLSKRLHKEERVCHFMGFQGMSYCVCRMRVIRVRIHHAIRSSIKGDASTHKRSTPTLGECHLIRCANKCENQVKVGFTVLLYRSIQTSEVLRSSSWAPLYLRSLVNNDKIRRLMQLDDKWLSKRLHKVCLSFYVLTIHSAVRFIGASKVQ